MSGPYKYDYWMRYIIIGNSGVGKSSILTRYVDQQFQNSFLPTIGVDFKTKTIEIEGKTIKQEFWDTAGQERFQTITRTYYRGAKGIIIVFDITDRNSFNSVEYWLEQVKENNSFQFSLLIIGNKTDLSHKREVTYEEGKRLSEQHGAQYFECSAKENQNIDKALEIFAIELVEKNKDQQNQPKADQINLEGEKIKKLSCC